MKENPVIEISHLTVYREQPILDDINWTVHQGEHWCILGANGSGKTSLLKTLMAYFAPTSGTIRISGKSYGKYDWRLLRRHIGLVSSHLTERMNRSLTVLDTVIGGRDATLNILIPHDSDDEVKAEHALAQVNSSHLAKRNWVHLSQGEKQRVLIARAMMSDPHVLILDEPCAGLDPVAREKFLNSIQEFASRSDAPSLILVTHHVEEIVPAITHILLLKEGRVLNFGKKQEILTSGWLSQTFSASVKPYEMDSRYSIKIAISPKPSMKDKKARC